MKKEKVNKMKCYQFFMILVVILISSCNQNVSNNNIVLKDSVSNESGIFEVDSCRNDNIVGASDVNKDVVSPTYFDFMDRESYYQLIKDVLKYDKKKLGIGIDSAIYLYSDDIISSDSIVKWWNMIP